MTQDKARQDKTARDTLRHDKDDEEYKNDDKNKDDDKDNDSTLPSLTSPPLHSVKQLIYRLSGKSGTQQISSATVRHPTDTKA